MEYIFISILNMSISAGWLILAVMLLRLVLRKIAKNLCCILWALVGIRLICPWLPQTVFSLIPSAWTVPRYRLSAGACYIQRYSSSESSGESASLGILCTEGICKRESFANLAIYSFAYLGNGSAADDHLCSLQLLEALS